MECSSSESRIGIRTDVEENGYSREMLVSFSLSFHALIYYINTILSTYILFCTINIFILTYFVDLSILLFDSTVREYWRNQMTWIRKKCGMKTLKFSRQVLSHMWPLMSLMVSIQTYIAINNIFY